MYSWKWPAVLCLKWDRNWCGKFGASHGVSTETPSLKQPSQHPGTMLAVPASPAERLRKSNSIMCLTSLNSSLCYRTDRRLTRCNMFALFLAESSLFSHVSFNNARNVLMQPPPKKINKNYPNPNKTKEITQRLKIQLTFQYPSSAAPGVPFRKSLICILKFWVYSGPRSFLLDCLT